MPQQNDLSYALLLEPQYRDYMWGGSRLRPGQLTAEAWVVFAGNRILTGPLEGKTLSEAAETYGSALLGEPVMAHTGKRFPLLIKLLDCAAWLSLQVHPNDAQARQLEGPGFFGKTEAWHILHADAGAEILFGFHPGVDPEAALQSVRDGSILEYVQRVPMHTGDTVFMRPGTLHALGPGLLVYEVQQTSDITYRVFDWNRPASSGRKLHIDQSLAVLDPSSTGQPIREPEFLDGGRFEVVSCDYFILETLTCQERAIALDTEGQSFHALTVVDGEVDLVGDGWRQRLTRYESAVVPAICGAYQVKPRERAKVLKASAV